jgi:hypothetical protein
MTAEAIETPDTRRRLRWWQEVLFVLAFYGIYSVIRNQFGSAGSPVASDAEALDHAREIIRLERAIGLFQEHTIQQWFIDWRSFIQFWNLFYGTFHFVVTAGCIVWLFRRFPDRYIRWRTTLACTTALALLGFAFYPLMPPRLLADHGLHYGFVDTLKDIGGLWSFDSGAMSKISNQYAAMPSLHFAWSTWCALVLVPTVRRMWVKVLAASYPVLTLFAIVVTANHYWLDAVGGAVILGAGLVLGTWWAARGPEADVVLVQPGQ